MYVKQEENHLHTKNKKKTKVRTIPDIFTDPNIINQAETSHEGGLHLKEFKNLWALSHERGAEKHVCWLQIKLLVEV